MMKYLNIFNIYIMGSIEVLTGFYFFTKFLHKKINWGFYLLFTVLGTAVITMISTDSIMQFFAYFLLLIAGGIFIYKADALLVLLYSALTIEIMQLCFGISNSILSILYPLFTSFAPAVTGTIFMLLGNTLGLLLSVLCCQAMYRYISFDETLKSRYPLMILAPILMMFLIGRYISSIFYGNVTSQNGNITTENANHYLILVVQLLGISSLFIIIYAYDKLVKNFHLRTSLSLLEQQEHFLLQYVTESKARYEKTKSFRHDIRNHITIIKGLLQDNKPEQAYAYISDMETMTRDLNLPYSTNNPVVDVLIGNKLGSAKDYGIAVFCSLHLPYPCSINDIDFCTIMSNALDNAICACKKTDAAEDKYIHVTGSIQGDFVLMEIKNSYYGKGVIKTGTGLQNIKSVTEKYHGSMSIKIHDGAFILSVLLIIPQQAEHISQQSGSSAPLDGRKKY